MGASTFGYCRWMDALGTHFVTLSPWSIAQGQSGEICHAFQSGARSMWDARNPRIMQMATSMLLGANPCTEGLAL